MSEDFISEERGYGFSVTQIVGPATLGASRRCYQVNVGDKFVTLTAWQMLQLFSHLLLHTQRDGKPI